MWRRILYTVDHLAGTRLGTTRPLGIVERLVVSLLAIDPIFNDCVAHKPSVGVNYNANIGLCLLSSQILEILYSYSDSRNKSKCDDWTEERLRLRSRSRSDVKPSKSGRTTITAKSNCGPVKIAAGRAKARHCSAQRSANPQRRS